MVDTFIWQSDEETVEIIAHEDGTVAVYGRDDIVTTIELLRDRLNELLEKVKVSPFTEP